MKFYHDLRALEAYADLQAARFEPCPADTCLVMSDVENSTEAIEHGRYKDINFASAACIQAIVADEKNFSLPFVFGGDGATILIANADRDRYIARLKGIQKYFRDSVQLKIRVAFIPVQSLYARNLKLYLAKASLTKPTEQALFMGDGLALAENVMKRKAPPLEGVLLLDPDEGISAEPLFEGLSCRWQPVPSAKGKVVSVIAQALAPGISDQSNVYREILIAIAKISGLPERSRPITANKLKYSWAPRGMALDLQKFPTFLPRFVKMAFYLPWVWALKLMFAARIRLPGFSTTVYLKEVEQSGDYFKIENALKLTLDCSSAEVAEITQILSAYEAAGKIAYGIQLSPATLMTCLIFQPSAGHHVHFVDGSDGGYSRASAQLKLKHSRASECERPALG